MKEGEMLSIKSTKGELDEEKDVPKLLPRRAMIPPDEDEEESQDRQQVQRTHSASKKKTKSRRSRLRKQFRYRGPTLPTIYEEDEADEGTHKEDANEDETGNEEGSATSLPMLQWENERPLTLPENIDDQIEVTEDASPEEPNIYVTLKEGEIISDSAMRKIWKRILTTVELQFTD